MPLDDALASAGMLVSLGRAIHPENWVDDMIAEKLNSSLEALF